MIRRGARTWFYNEPALIRWQHRSKLVRINGEFEGCLYVQPPRGYVGDAIIKEAGASHGTAVLQKSCRAALGHSGPVVVVSWERMGRGHGQREGQMEGFVVSYRYICSGSLRLAFARYLGLHLLLCRLLFAGHIGNLSRCSSRLRSSASLARLAACCAYC